MSSVRLNFEGYFLEPIDVSINEPGIKAVNIAAKELNHDRRDLISATVDGYYVDIRSDIQKASDEGRGDGASGEAEKEGQHDMYHIMYRVHSRIRNIASLKGARCVK